MGLQRVGYNLMTTTTTTRIKDREAGETESLENLNHTGCCCGNSPWAGHAKTLWDVTGSTFPTCFWLRHTAWGILDPSGFEPGPSPVKAQSPNRWTAREFPRILSSYRILCGNCGKLGRVDLLWLKEVLVKGGCWSVPSSSPRLPLPAIPPPKGQRTRRALGDAVCKEKPGTSLDNSLFFDPLIVLCK